MKTAKKYSRISFLLFSMLAYVAPVFAAGPQPGSGSGWNIGNYAGFGLPKGTISKIIENLLLWGLGIFGFIAIIGFVISGVMYLTAAGDEDQQKRAKRTMYYSIIGVIVGLIGFVILKAVGTLLEGGANVTF